MNIVLDLLGSMIIRGVIALAILRVSVSMNDSLYRKAAESRLSQNLSVASEIIYLDFKRLGYNAGAGAVAEAEPTSVRFWADLTNRGAADEVEYYMEPLGFDTTQVALFRRVNAETPIAIATGVTKFQLSYFDSVGAATTTPSIVRSLSIRVSIEQSYSTIGVNPKASWECHIFPPNI
jgi:hypothetical protein